jgi:hypothetical protein
MWRIFCTNVVILFISVMDRYHSLVLLKNVKDTVYSFGGY